MDDLAVQVIGVAIWALAWPRVLDVAIANWWRGNHRPAADRGH